MLFIGRQDIEQIHAHFTLDWRVHKIGYTEHHNNDQKFKWAKWRNEDQYQDTGAVSELSNYASVICRVVSFQKVQSSCKI